MLSFLIFRNVRYVRLPPVPLTWLSIGRISTGGIFIGRILTGGVSTSRIPTGRSKARSVPTTISQRLRAWLQQLLKGLEHHSSHSKAWSGACLQQSPNGLERAYSSHLEWSVPTAVTQRLRACLQQSLKGLEWSVPTEVTQRLGWCLQQSLNGLERAYSSHSKACNVPTAVTKRLRGCLQQSLICLERAYSSYSRA